MTGPSCDDDFHAVGILDTLCGGQIEELLLLLQTVFTGTVPAAGNGFGMVILRRFNWLQNNQEMG